jgi:hypothetical protein
VEHGTCITQNTTNHNIDYTNYYKLTTTITTKYFWIYLHPEVIVIFVAALLIRVPVTFGVHGSDDDGVVPPSLLKTMSRLHFASNFSSEVLSWFMNNSSEETSSSVSSSSESEESSSPSSLLESHNLFLTIEDSTSFSNLLLPLSLDTILRRREFREGESDQLDERERESGRLLQHL